jgi:single-strand DNA-binding protein
MYINEVTVCGNLTRDPEIKALPSGVTVANFSVATNRKYKDRDGKTVEEVEYHNVVFFAKRAEVIGQYFSKGDNIYVRGRLVTRSWDKDGVKMYRTEIMGEDFKFGTTKKKEGSSDRSTHASSEPLEYPEEEINPEDIPF